MLLCIVAMAGCGGTVAATDSAPGAAAKADSADTAELKEVPPTPIAIETRKLDKPTWDPKWTRVIEENLPANLLSHRRAKQVKALCPRYRQLTKTQRRVFWAYFFQALAGAEAGLNPATDVHHTDPQVDVVDLVTHRRVRQEGLLQLTYMDRLRYGCNFDWVRDKDLPEHELSKSILQPANNLLCGIQIVENQLMKRHEPLLSDSSYWSTLRPDNASFAVFKKQMANEPAYCWVDTDQAKPVAHSPEPMTTAKNERLTPQQTSKARNGTLAGQTSPQMAGQMASTLR